MCLYTSVKTPLLQQKSEKAHHQQLYTNINNNALTERNIQCYPELLDY
jgi:hypothetical protein